MEYSEFPLGSYIDEIASLDKASTHSEENECFAGFGKQTEHYLPPGSAQKKANLLKKDERLFDFPETLFTRVSNEEDIAYDSRTSDIQHIDYENLSNISGLLEFLNNITERDENGEMFGNMKSIACPLMENKSFKLHHLGYNPLCIQEYREQDGKCFTLDSTSSFDSQGSLEGKNNSSSNRDSIISLASSLGILNTSQMSSISLEGMAGGNTSRDSIDLLNELEELSFQNKKLQAENGRLKMQISQTEETTSQLMNDNDELKLKLNSFQIMLDKSKYLEREHDEIKAILEQGENTKLELEKNIANLQKENSHLTLQIKDLEQELMMTYATVENYMKEGELTTILKDKIEEVTHQKNICKTELDEKTTLYEELKQMVKEYAKTTEILQQEKNVLEVQLYKAQEEVQSIVEAVGINYYWNVENVDDELDSCDTEDIVDDISAHYNASLTKSLKSQKIISRFFEKQPFYSSTPFRQQVLKSPSICAEMKDLICENDCLPTPICGKEIHFLSCNEETASPLPCLTFPDKKLTLQEQLMNTSSVYHEGPQSRNKEQEEKVSLERVMFLYPDAEDSKEKYCVKSPSSVQVNLPEDQIHIKPELKQNRDDKIRYENSQKLTEILLKEVLHVKKILKSLQVEAVKFLGVYQAYPLKKEQPITANEITASLDILTSEIEDVETDLAYLTEKISQTRLPNQKATSQSKGFFDDGTGTNLYWRDLDDEHFSIYRNKNRIFPVSTSQPSSPLNHVHSATCSCPTRPCETPVVTKSTQTEPVMAKVSYDNWLSNWMCQSDDVQEKTYLRASSEEMPERTTGISNNTHEGEKNVPPHTSFVYRNRSFSFPSAEGRNNLSYGEDRISPKDLDCSETSEQYSQKPKKFQPVSTELDVLRWIQHSEEDSKPFNKEVRFSEYIKGSSGLVCALIKQLERRSKINVVKKTENAKKEKRKKRNGISRNKNFTPKFMEIIKTESEKGSARDDMESEDTDLISSNVIISPTISNDSAFPSVSDSFLRYLGLHKESPHRNEHFSEQEIESKCWSLLSAFKIDKLTLSKRLQLQRKKRNIAEKSVENAIKTLKASLNILNRLSTDHQVRDLVMRMFQQINILQQSSSKASSRAEIYGAVQQEDRMNCAFEVMVMYIENMKRIYQNKPHELKETQKLVITESRVVPVNSLSAVKDDRDQQSFCYLSVANLPSFISDLSSHFVHLQAIQKVYKRASTNMLCRIASAEPYQNPVPPSFSIVLDSKSHFFPSSGTFSGNVDLASNKSLMTKLTFSLVSCSVPSSTRGRSYSLPAILPTDFDKPTPSISLPIKVERDINETTEFQKENSCDYTSARDPSNEFGNSKRNSYKNTKDKEKKKERPKGILRSTEALGVETKFEIICGGNTSYLRGIYNDLVNKDSATICGRFCFEISIILVISGFLTLFLTFLPYQAMPNAYHAYPVSIEEIFETLLSPYLSLKPPSNVI